MIDGTILTILPPIIASIFAYAIAIKRSRLVQLKTITEIQTSAIKLVQQAEEKMRAELRADIESLRTENNTLRVKVEHLEEHRHTSDELINTLKQEITTLRDTLDVYKKLVEENKITMASNKQEMDSLRETGSV